MQQEICYQDILFSLKDNDCVDKKIIESKYTQSIDKFINKDKDIGDCPSNNDNVFTFLSNAEKYMKKGSNFNNNNNNINNIKNELLGITLLIVDPKYTLIEKKERIIPLKKLSESLIEKIPFLIKISKKNEGHDEIIKQSFNVNFEPVCTNPEVVYNYISTYSSKRLIVFHIDLESMDYVKYEFTKKNPGGEMFYIIKLINKDIREYHSYSAEEFSDKILLSFILKDTEIDKVDYLTICKIYKLLTFNNKRCTKKEKVENILAIISNKDE